MNLFNEKRLIEQIQSTFNKETDTMENPEQQKEKRLKKLQTKLIHSNVNNIPLTIKLEALKKGQIAKIEIISNQYHHKNKEAVLLINKSSIKTKENKEIALIIRILLTFLKKLNKSSIVRKYINDCHYVNKNYNSDPVSLLKVVIEESKSIENTMQHHVCLPNLPTIDALKYITINEYAIAAEMMKELYQSLNTIFEDRLVATEKILNDFVAVRRKNKSSILYAPEMYLNEIQNKTNSVFPLAFSENIQVEMDKVVKVIKQTMKSLPKMHTKPTPFKLIFSTVPIGIYKIKNTEEYVFSINKDKVYKASDLEEIRLMIEAISYLLQEKKERDLIKECNKAINVKYLN